MLSSQPVPDYEDCERYYNKLYKKINSNNWVLAGDKINKYLNVLTVDLADFHHVFKTELDVTHAELVFKRFELILVLKYKCTTKELIVLFLKHYDIIAEIILHYLNIDELRVSFAHNFTKYWDELRRNIPEQIRRAVFNNQKFAECIAMCGEYNKQQILVNCLYSDMQIFGSEGEFKNAVEQLFPGDKLYKARQYFWGINQDNFEKQCRLFLNEINGIYSTVLTFRAESIYLTRRLKVIKAYGTDLWIDINRSIETITFSCSPYTFDISESDETSIVLEIFASTIEKCAVILSDNNDDVLLQFHLNDSMMCWSDKYKKRIGRMLNPTINLKPYIWKEIFGNKYIQEILKFETKLQFDKSSVDEEVHNLAKTILSNKMPDTGINNKHDKQLLKLNVPVPQHPLTRNQNQKHTQNQKSLFIQKTITNNPKRTDTLGYQSSTFINPIESTKTNENNLTVAQPLVTKHVNLLNRLTRSIGETSNTDMIGDKTPISCHIDARKLPSKRKLFNPATDIFDKSPLIDKQNTFTEGSSARTMISPYNVAKKVIDNPKQPSTTVDFVSTALKNVQAMDRSLVTKIRSPEVDVYAFGGINPPEPKRRARQSRVPLPKTISADPARKNISYSYRSYATQSKDESNMEVDKKSKPKNKAKSIISKPKPKPKAKPKAKAKKIRFADKVDGNISEQNLNPTVEPMERPDNRPTEFQKLKETGVNNVKSIPTIMVSDSEPDIPRNANESIDSMRAQMHNLTTDSMKLMPGNCSIPSLPSVQLQPNDQSLDLPSMREVLQSSNDLPSFHIQSMDVSNTPDTNTGEDINPENPYLVYQQIIVVQKPAATDETADVRNLSLNLSPFQQNGDADIDDDAKMLSERYYDRIENLLTDKANQMTNRMNTVRGTYKQKIADEFHNFTEQQANCVNAGDEKMFQIEQASEHFLELTREFNKNLLMRKAGQLKNIERINEIQNQYEEEKKRLNTMWDNVRESMQDELDQTKVQVWNEYISETADIIRDNINNVFTMPIE